MTTTYVDAVIERTVLGDRCDDRLVVGGRVDCAGTVCTSREAVSHGSRQLAAHCTVVQTLYGCVSFKKVNRLQILTWKKANFLGSVGVTWSRAVNCSITM